MKSVELVKQLNKQELGTGFIWDVVDGKLPKLVPGGSTIEPARLDELKAAIEDADSRHVIDYTEDSWADMQKALTKARELPCDSGNGGFGYCGAECSTGSPEEKGA